MSQSKFPSFKEFLFAAVVIAMQPLWQRELKLSLGGFSKQEMMAQEKACEAKGRQTVKSEDLRDNQVGLEKTKKS